MLNKIYKSEISRLVEKEAWEDKDYKSNSKVMQFLCIIYNYHKNEKAE